MYRLIFLICFLNFSQVFSDDANQVEEKIRSFVQHLLKDNKLHMSTINKEAYSKFANK